MGDQSSDSKPYDSTFKTLMRYCTELLIALINYTFGERFDLGAAVTFLQSEVFATGPDGERSTRTADSVFRLADYMYFLLPFCLFWYGRDGLKKCNNDESRLAELQAMLDDILGRLRKAMDDGRISDFNRSMVLDAMNYVSRKLADGYENVIKAVKEKMGEEIIEFPTLRKLREAREEGLNEGRNEGLREGHREGALAMLCKLFNNGSLSISAVLKEVDMSEADFRARAAQFQGV